MKIDIDRLHKVINGELTGRGCGKTFARICQLAGLVELQHKHIFCKITRYDDIIYIKDMMIPIFEHFQLPLVRKDKHHWESLNSQIFFVTEEDWDRETQGEYIA